MVDLSFNHSVEESWENIQIAIFWGKCVYADKSLCGMANLYKKTILLAINSTFKLIILPPVAWVIMPCVTEEQV